MLLFINKPRVRNTLGFCPFRNGAENALNLGVITSLQIFPPVDVQSITNYHIEQWQPRIRLSLLKAHPFKSRESKQAALMRP